MSVSVRLNLKGLDVVNKKIAGAIDISMYKLVKMIERDARIFAPRDTGLLKASMASAKIGRLKYKVFNPLQYAGIMEKPGRVRREGRRPYFLPAIEKNVPQFSRLLIQEISKIK